MYKGSYRGSVVAVKKVTIASMPEKTSAREAIASALEVEATRMGSLRHPNIVLFMGACLQQNHFCIVSEYCTRGSLYDVLHGKRQELQWTLRLRLALGAARGLLYLHSADPPLVHSQLKSTNILVDDSWNAKLADFGTRRVAGAVLGNKSSRRMDVATGSCTDGSFDYKLLRWTAPELLKLGVSKVLLLHGPTSFSNEAVDIYSFGFVMWELATSHVPFDQYSCNEEIIPAVLSGKRPAIDPSSCSVEWAEIITRCWAQEPEDRPSASEIVSVLEEINRQTRTSSTDFTYHNL